MVKIGEKTRFIILGALLVATGLTYYLVNITPDLVFKKDTIYYMPGKNNDCTWHVYFENNVYLKRGSFSNIFIGLPNREQNGAIKGIVESTATDLLLAFSFPGNIRQAPIVLTARHNQITAPIDHVRFRLFNSTLLTILIFKDHKSCISRSSK